ncbi:MAG: hypothetical protein M3R01_12315 [Actinomycetota bacterium]|nr:hypothetical protein [Actinomycetota bacterium]
MTGASRYRLQGVIASAGFASGDRVVVGHWPVSPLGPMDDVMWATAGGERVLLAPDEAVAAFVTAVYRFDRVEVVPFAVAASATVLDLSAGPLALRLEAGRGWRLPLPRRRPPWFTARVEAPLARLLMGVRTHGVSASGVEEWYQALRWRPLTLASASVDGVDLGALGLLEPPLGVGFSEPPRSPSWVEVRPLLHDPGGTLSAIVSEARPRPSPTGRRSRGR